MLCIMCEAIRFERRGLEKVLEKDIRCTSAIQNSYEMSTYYVQTRPEETFEGCKVCARLLLEYQHRIVILLYWAPHLRLVRGLPRRVPLLKRRTNPKY